MSASLTTFCHNLAAKYSLLCFAAGMIHAAVATGCHCLR